MSFSEATFKKYPRWVNASSTIQTIPKRCSTLRHWTAWCRLSEHFRLYSLLLALLSDQRLVDVGDHTCRENKQKRRSEMNKNVIKKTISNNFNQSVRKFSQRRFKSNFDSKWKKFIWSQIRLFHLVDLGTMEAHLDNKTKTWLLIKSNYWEVQIIGKSGKKSRVWV